MNKRYMDFVPSAAKKNEAVKKPATGKVVARQTTVVRKVSPKSQIVRELPTPKKNTIVTSRRNVVDKPKSTVSEAPKRTYEGQISSRGFSIKDEPTLGVIEDLNPKYVNNDLPKRPLNSTNGPSVKDAKAQKVGARSEAKVNNRTNNEKKTAFAVPKSPFINQEKVIKRPLSKNAYVAKTPEVQPEKSGPVTIIAKPEKDAHVSLIVTIIITIILGAAAGTVAFLLLPK